MNIKKEFIPSTIGIGIICLNIPIVLLLYFLKPALMLKFATIVVPTECIMMGLTIIYTELKVRKNERNNYKVCEGIIIKSKFTLHNNSTWLKSPIVSYVVNEKKYETTLNVGINGIFSFFIKGKKVKVYYNENNPKITSFYNMPALMFGAFIIIVGLYIFLVC